MGNLTHEQTSPYYPFIRFVDSPVIAYKMVTLIRFLKIKLMPLVIHFTKSMVTFKATTYSAFIQSFDGNSK